MYRLTKFVTAELRLLFYVSIYTNCLMTFVMLEANEDGVLVEKRFNQALYQINSVAYFPSVIIICMRCIVLRSVNEYPDFLH